MSVIEIWIVIVGMMIVMVVMCVLFLIGGECIVLFECV